MAPDRARAWAIASPGRRGADLADLRLTLGKLVITADAVRSYASVSCMTGNAVPQLQGHSVLVNLRLDGKPPPVGDDPVAIPLLGIGVLPSQRANRVERRAHPARAVADRGPLLRRGAW